MTLRPLTLREANRLIDAWHSHHKPTSKHRWAIGAEDGGALVGAIVVANPVAPAFMDGYTFEVARLCTNGGRLANGHARCAASFLLGASWRSARAMGVRRMVSYCRVDEDGTCYRAAGWKAVAEVAAEDWSRRASTRPQPNLPIVIEPTTEIVDRVRWEVAA